MLTLGSENISPAARRIDDKVGYVVTVIGIPSAFLLHGYVGFIFGSVKANPWWSSPLMPIVFLFSAMVSGIAAVLMLYMALMQVEKMPIDMPCLDTIAKYLFYTFVIDFSLEMLDLVHRTYEADESFRSLDFMVHTRLWFSHVIVQIILCTLVPLAILGGHPALAFLGGSAQGYVSFCLPADPGWNLCHALERRDRGPVVFQEFLGYTSYKVEFAAREGLLPAIGLMILPFIIVVALVKLLPPWEGEASKV